MMAICNPHGQWCACSPPPASPLPASRPPPAVLPTSTPGIPRSPHRSVTQATSPQRSCPREPDPPQAPPHLRGHSPAGRSLSPPLQMRMPGLGKPPRQPRGCLPRLWGPRSSTCCVPRMFPSDRVCAVLLPVLVELLAAWIQKAITSSLTCKLMQRTLPHGGQCSISTHSGKLGLQPCLPLLPFQFLRYRL